MTATWSVANIGSGTGNYNLSSTGYNNPKPILCKNYFRYD